MTIDGIKEHSFGIIPLRRHDGVWQLLLVQHSRAKYWGYPKGHAEKGESPRDAAARELLEETGLTIVRYLSDQTFEEHYHYRLRGTFINKTVVFFVAEVSGTLVLQEHEISGAKWVPLVEAPKSITYDSDKSICHEVIASLGL